MESLQAKEKIIGLIIGIVSTVLITFVPALEPLEEHLVLILGFIASWIVGGSIVEAADKKAAAQLAAAQLVAAEVKETE